MSTSSSNWCVWDNFELYYYGPTIGGEAEALPTETMTADTWYYFDIAVAGNYNLTTTTIGDIVYTTDETILIENESSVTDNFSGTENVALTAGRYYVKSASAQTLAVAAASYSYVLGDATLSVADGSYTQNQTFTVTFASAATSDPDASPALVDNSTATVNGTSVSLTAVTNGFSLDLGTLAANTAYVISIPASVYGYADQSMNEAISLTVNTPTVFDGEYVLYDATNKLFLGRGNSWGTEASADKYGIPFNLATDATGVSSIEFVDWTGVYLFLTGTSIFTDGSSTGWTLEPTTDGYYLKTSDGAYYTAHASGGYGEYVYATDAESSATVWTLKTTAERDAIIDAYPTDNITNVISASGISTTAANFETYLSENYTAVDYTSAVGTATFAGEVGDWTWNATNRTQDNQPAYGTGYAEVWCATGYYSQTIAASSLPAGIYKVTVDGFERRATTATSTSLGAAGYNVVSSFLSANDEQVRFTDWYDTTTRPGNVTGAVTTFTNGEATNELYIYLDGETDLTLTVKKPNYIHDCWMIFNNVTLTRYCTAATMSISASSYGTFIAPFDVTIPDDVTAYTVSAVSDNVLTMAEVETTIPANTPVVVENTTEAAIAETFYGQSTASKTSYTSGLLTGVYAATEITSGYVLQTIDDAQAFYAVDANDAITVPANKCYLTVSSGATKAFYFDTATAIKNVIEGAQKGEIFDVTGRKVSRMQKGGVYVVNGQKVIVK
ncbi:MAG: hypothetical protein K6F94_06370 [Bacteroidaceae bacterium]|nr:hypothetical protein [Bacteroidaceae bacterium]